VLADLGDGPSLYVGRNFEFAGGIETLNIARYAGTQCHSVGGGVGRPPVFDKGYSGVIELAAFDDGSGSALYAAVRTREAESGWVPTTAIARWDGTKWHTVVADFDGRIHEMIVHDDGSGPALYIAGEFSELNGVTVNSSARLRSCEADGCPADVTGDRSVGLPDLNLVLASFGQQTDVGDTNGGGFAGLADLNAVLADFGDDC
jgi:hypothetical protein